VLCRQPRIKGKKALVGVAVEVRERRGYDRAGMAILRDGSAASLHPFLTGHVEPGTQVITDTRRTRSFRPSWAMAENNSSSLA